MVFNFRRFGRTEKFLCEDCSEQRKCDRCLGKDRFLCDYIAREDSVLAVFPYNTADDLINALNGQESMRGTLLRAALKQRQMLLEMYAGFKNLVRQFHTFVETEYNDYTMLCSQMRIDGQGFTRMDNFKPLDMVHMAENWEVNNSTSLTKKDILMNT